LLKILAPTVKLNIFLFFMQVLQFNFIEMLLVNSFRGFSHFYLIIIVEVFSVVTRDI